VLYLEPELGVRVGARDPLARRVLATLTRLRSGHRGRTEVQVGNG
jgi:hypothetical protein